MHGRVDSLFIILVSKKYCIDNKVYRISLEYSVLIKDNRVIGFLKCNQKEL